MRYPVEVVDDLFGESPVLAETVRTVTACDCPRILLVADGNVVQHTDGLGTKIGHYFNTHGLTLAGGSVVLSGGEKMKTVASPELQRVLSAFVAARPAAQGCVLALGGGTVLDVVGFAAAQVAGTRVVRVPTTPAALFAGAFATCAALDLDGRKDALTLPAEPSAVLLDASFATTVLDGVWRGGFGEAVRLALVADVALVKRLEALASAVRGKDISALVTVLEAVVTLRRRGVGTSLGDATAACLEELSGFKLPHGYAVPIAVALEANYAAACGLLTEADAQRVSVLLRDCGALDGLAHSRHLLEHSEEILSARFGDEKMPRFVLSALGRVVPDENPKEPLYQQALDMLKYTS